MGLPPGAPSRCMRLRAHRCGLRRPCATGAWCGTCQCRGPDAAARAGGYAFCGLWYCIFCCDQVYLKHVTTSVEMDSNWGRVLYSNFLASVPLFFLCFGEGDAILAASNEDLAVVGVTVVLGTAMSYYAWLARSLVSATLFTILGNVCKVLSIGINVMFWDKHASPIGITCLVFCLVAAYLYKQAPLRNPSGALPTDQSPTSEPKPHC